MIATAPPLDLTTQKLLAHLWRAGEFAYYWTASEARRADKPKEAKEKLSFWFETDNPAPIPSAHGRVGPRHLYFSVNPTLARGSQYQRAKKGERDIAAINTLFGEFDFKDFESISAAVAHVESLHPAPSVIVSSGGGLHCYWLLAKPFVLSDNEQYARAQRAQYAWVDYVKSDASAKDLYRVLRIPETLNYKSQYGPDYPKVKIIKADFDCLYSLAELSQLCKPATPTPKPRRDNHIADWTTDLETAADCLKRLDKWRVEKYGAWVDVGMSLKGLGDAGLRLWDEWSQGGSKYNPDECEQKWDSFSADGLTLGSLIHWANEDNPRQRAAAGSRNNCSQTVPRPPGPKELARLAVRETYLTEARARREALQSRKQAHYKPGTIPFGIADDEEYQQQVSRVRDTFSSAAAWREFVTLNFDELDAAHEYRVKLEENKEHKMSFCGKPYKRLTATGEIKAGRILCGLCESCKKLDRLNLRRALETAILADPEQCLMIVTVACKAERARIKRRLRENQHLDKVLPVASELPEFDILMPSAAAALVGEYEPRELLIAHLNDARLDRWLETPAGERQSGKLIPSRRELREVADPDRFEVPSEAIFFDKTTGVNRINRRMVKRFSQEDSDPEAISLDLPGVVCEGFLPEVAIDHEVHDATELQSALNEIADQQRKILFKRGHVILGVITSKKYYALTDVPPICQLFNERNEALKAKKEARRRKKTE